MSLSCLLLSTLAATAAHAQFTSAAQIQNLVPNARAQGMGRAFTAVARDPWAVWWNPGALGLQSDLSVGLFSTARLVPDLAPDVHIRSAAVAGARNGIGYGAHFGYLDYGKSRASAEGRERGGLYSHETAIHLAGGVDLVRVLSGRPAPISVGVGASVKRLHVDSAPSWTLSDEAVTGTGYDADLGLLVEGRVPIQLLGEDAGRLSASFGYFRRNLFDGDIEYTGSGDSDPLLSFNRFGFAGHLELGWDPNLGTVLDLLGAFDWTDPPHRYNERSIRNCGVEVGALRTIYLRYGKISDRSGDIVDNTWGVGIGPDLLLRGRLRSIRVRFDYAKVPQARGLDHVQYYALSGGVGL